MGLLLAPSAYVCEGVPLHDHSQLSLCIRLGQKLLYFLSCRWYFSLVFETDGLVSIMIVIYCNPLYFLEENKVSEIWTVFDNIYCACYKCMSNCVKIGSNVLNSLGCKWNYVFFSHTCYVDKNYPLHHKPIDLLKWILLAWDNMQVQFIFCWYWLINHECVWEWIYNGNVGINRCTTSLLCLF